MSFWTHCSCRIFVVGTLSQLTKTESCFGKQLNFEDSREKWNYACEHPEEFMPFGSEGSIELLKTRKRRPIPDTEYYKDRYKKEYKFFGALRDYNDENKVFKWFTDLIAKINREPGYADIVEADFEASGYGLIKFHFETDKEMLELNKVEP